MSPTFVEQLGRMVCATGFASAARPKACTLPMDRYSNTQPACLRYCQANLLERHWRSQWHTGEAHWRMANVAVPCRKRRMARREGVEDRQTAALADQASRSGHWTTSNPWPAGRVCAARSCCGSSPSKPPGPPA